VSSRSILLNPGPVTISNRVRSALTRGDWCHREPEFAELTRRINVGLCDVYDSVGFESVILTGSGTCAVEGMLATFAPDETVTLVAANGVYGERMALMLAAHGKPHKVVDAGWFDAIDLDKVERELQANDGITHLAAVQHETTTGRLNDLTALGALCKAYDVKLLLDAVSSFGAEHIDFVDWNLEALAATANKCIHGVPGLSFVLASQQAWSGPAHNAGSVYLDLRAYHRAQHAEGYSPFTQSVQVAFALDEALAELADEGGWQKRQETYRMRASRIHECLLRLGIETLLPVSAYSSVLWSYRLPSKLSYEDLHDPLKREGFVIYAGQGSLSHEIFRLAFMGDIVEDDLKRLCAVLEMVLAES